MEKIKYCSVFHTKCYNSHTKARNHFLLLVRALDMLYSSWPQSLQNLCKDLFALGKQTKHCICYSYIIVIIYTFSWIFAKPGGH